MEIWEYGALDIHDPERSTLRRYFEELRERMPHLTGDVLEFGVSTGRSLVTTCAILRELGLTNQVFGYDSFSGFPENSLHENDSVARFMEMREKDEITADHLSRVARNLKLVEARLGNKPADVGSVSNSGNFSSTSLDLVNRKLDVLGLSEKVQLIDGDFTLDTKHKISSEKIAVVLLDSDLYQTYRCVLPCVWSRLERGGFIYLDEYYSLKFPGPMIAVNEFVSAQDDARLKKLDDWLGFERWILERY